MSDLLGDWLMSKEIPMKAKPVRLTPHDGYEQCSIDDATHVTLNIPGPTGLLTLPVIRRGTRDGTNCWTWNGSTDAPTLRPSVLSRGHDWRCHSWINDGAAQFLDDCSHELKGQTVALLDVEGGNAATVRPLEEKLREAVLQAGYYGAWSGGVLLEQAAEEIERLRAMEANATRYLWLRSTTNHVTSHGERIDVRENPSLWDASIDAAIAKAKGVEICPNCDSALPQGCNGVFKDDGEACRFAFPRKS